MAAMSHVGRALCVPTEDMLGVALSAKWHQMVAMFLAEVTLLHKWLLMAVIFRAVEV